VRRRTSRRTAAPLLATTAGGGLATFPMRFNAIVFRPFKGEVFDAVVTTVNKLGFFAQVGPLQVFVSKHLIPCARLSQSHEPHAIFSVPCLPPLTASYHRKRRESMREGRR
jgi:hypothetical protein